jgi:hypothetical protein
MAALLIHMLPPVSPRLEIFLPRSAPQPPVHRALLSATLPSAFSDHAHEQTELEKELYMAQDAVFELKRRSEQLEDDNLRLERALQTSHKSMNVHHVADSSRQAELEE